MGNNNRPQYLQLRDIILEQIESDYYSEGDVLPSERTLAELHNVSIVTVRKCIGLMAEEGYIFRDNGNLTILNNRKISHRLGDLLGIRGELLEISNKVKVNELYKGYETPNYEVIKNLELEAQQVYTFVRLFSIEDKPLLINYSYIAPDKGKLIENIDLNNAVIFSYLEECGYRISHAEQMISSGICTAKQEKYLDYPAGQPVLIRKRTTYLEDGSSILYDIGLYRGDSYQYTIKLSR